MDKMSLVLDVWEGQLEIDEAELLVGGVDGIVIRLNDMNGGHHMDAGFAKQWVDVEMFERWPYFVYNPWVSGKENYDWLVKHMPAGCPSVAVDVEVKKPGLNPVEYGLQLQEFMWKAEIHWQAHIYTGEWFLPNVEPWPKDADYWWAQYPLSMYPSRRVELTWEELQRKIEKLTWPPANAYICPGKVKMWQCSGDRFILPGTSRAMDINLFPGDLNDLVSWLGYKERPELLTLDQRMERLEREARSRGWNL